LGVSSDTYRPPDLLEDLLSHTRPLLAALLALAGLLAFAGSASAKDRNHDRIPDRWETRHHLSLHHNQARRDQDRDGLRNRAEFKAGTNPRKADSDNDGIGDGDENTGTVVSFDGTVLKISVFGQSDPLVGQVDQGTEIECDESGDASMSSHGDDGPGDDQGGDDQGGDQGDDDQGDDHGDDHGDDNNAQQCGTDQLVAGAKVSEAEVRLVNGQAVFEKVELQP
jgi:hypothetical protein